MTENLRDLVTTDLSTGLDDDGTVVRSAKPRIAGLGRFSGLLVWAVLIVLFSLWVPKTFLTSQNLEVIASTQAVTAMLAIGLTIPLAAGVFDLSCAAIMGFAVNLVAFLQVHGWNALVATVVTILISAVFGAANGFVVVRLHVDSFIATLGMSSVLAALTYWITNGQQIYQGLSPRFLAFGSAKFLGITAPFWYMLILGAAVFVVLEFTPIGRYLYARGGNSEAARLAGLNTDRIAFGSLVTSGLIAGVTGVVLLTELGLASYDVGPPYLLAAFSAVFLGSTQIKTGRVNVIGTLIAIYLLATGIKGLQLAGAPIWVNDLFNGLALIVAVALATRTARRRR